MSYRAIIVIIALALTGAAMLKIARVREERRANESDGAGAERVRRFWDAYRQASQRRAAGELEEALALYHSALEVRPDHEDALYYAGNCYLELGRFRDAIASYERLIAVNPLGSSRGYVQLGLAHASLEPGAPVDLEKARGFFHQALQVDPDSGAMLGIAEVALLENRLQEAWDALEKDNADNSMGMASPYLLGYLCWRKSKHDEAWRWFRLAVQRGEFKKPGVKWTEEGDVKADPELRWRALARQSVFGAHWLRLRAYLKAPDMSPAVMDAEYRRLQKVVTR